MDKFVLGIHKMLKTAESDMDKSKPSNNATLIRGVKRKRTNPCKGKANLRHLDQRILKIYFVSYTRKHDIRSIVV